MPRKSTKKPEKAQQATIFETEKQVEIEEAKKKKEENDRKSAEGRKFHAEYNKNKKLILDLEKGNLQYIFLLKSSNDYWKMFSTSALYFARVLAKRHNKKVKVHIDKDMKASYDGYVAIRDLDALTELLAAEGAVLDASKAPNENIIAYKLKELISEDEIRGIRLKEKQEREKVNDILKTAEQFPDINFAMNEFCNRIIIEYRHQLTRPQERIIRRMLDIALDMKVDFRDMTNRVISKHEWLEKNTCDMNHIEAYIDVLTVTGTLSMDNIMIIVSLYGKLKQLIARGRF